MLHFTLNSRASTGSSKAVEEALRPPIADDKEQGKDTSDDEIADCSIRHDSHRDKVPSFTNDSQIASGQPCTDGYWQLGFDASASAP